MEKGGLAAWKEEVDSAEPQERLKDRALPMKAASEGHPPQERAAQLTCMQSQFWDGRAILKIQTSILGAPQFWDRLKVDRTIGEGFVLPAAPAPATQPPEAVHEHAHTDSRHGNSC